MGTVLARDIPGSSLTIAYTNYEQDQATRKYLVSSTSRQDAITSTISAGASDGSALSYGHPDESALKVNQITASAVGPDRWLVTVQYIRNKFTGFPTAGGTTENLFNCKVSYEAVQVYRTGPEFFNGLPNGQFAHSRNFNVDPKMPPIPYIWNRPIFILEIPFSGSTNPLGSGSLGVAVTDVGLVNGSARTAFGITWKKGTLRYEGMSVSSQQNNTGVGTLGSVQYYGTYRYAFSAGGFYTQRALWDEVEKEWITKNEVAYDTGSIP